MHARLEIEQVLESIAHAWRHHRLGELGDFLDDDVVFVAPGFRERLVGRAPLVERFRRFLDEATITEYVERDLTVDVFGDTAVATFLWEMEWDFEASTFRQRGHDVVVLTQRAQGWRVVFRLQVAPPTAPVSA